MTGLRIVSLIAVLAASGCSVGTTSPPAYPQQMAWTGPPGGAIDEGYGYQLPAEGDGSYEGSYPPDADQPSAEVEPSADPADPGYALGDVTDTEIDVTLQSAGEWIEDPDYGRVWLPYTTVVGADFTPYDSSGDWIYTDYGWSFASDWDWGWLAFHFGRWALFGDDRWGWVPDHTWGPSWCEWRHGEGTVGWRPMAPSIRDHRGGGAGGWTASTQGPANGRGRGSRTPDTTWRFAAQTEFGLRHRPTAFAIGDGLRVTAPVARPPAGTLSGRAATLMGSRLRGQAWTQTHPTIVRPNVDRSTGATGARPGRPWQGPGELGQSTGGGRPWMKPPAAWENPRRGVQGAQTWQAPPSYGNTRTWQTPPRSDGSRAWRQPPAASVGGGPRGTWQQPPSRGSYTPPADRAPSRGIYTPPSRGSYAPPSRGSYTPPSRPSMSWGGSRGGSYQAPRGSGSSAGSFSPSRSSGSSGSSAGSFSPSRSSGSSGSSRASGSSSGSSRSSGSSSSSSGSSRGGGGGRRR
ncbi:MAG: hypothetical protein IPQ07_08435 [Myxococcales bacterium]|nr:hypothetical protein [Myxococcales bacterium]